MSETVAPPDEGTLGWRDFLTDKPPGTRARIDRAAYVEHPTSWVVQFRIPELQLYCDGDCRCVSYCNGVSKSQGKLFGTTEGGPFPKRDIPPAQNLPCDAVFCYTCEKCNRAVKSYDIRFWTLAMSSTEIALVEVQKLAEWPPFEPSTPSKVISLVGPDRDLFLKGRRAEIEGLGVGAFSYYRRIIEGQKNRLLDEIIRVARHLGVTEDAVDRLEAAKRETQFSRAVETVKDVIPPALCIKGHNPFTLLHGALSEGLHNASDETCLAAANDIRLLLVAFAERLTEAMQGQNELDEAINRLVNRNR